MKDRNKFLWNQDDEIQNNELYGVKQLFENGGLYPDTRSRWMYVRYRLKSVGELQRYSKFRIDTVVEMLQNDGHMTSIESTNRKSKAPDHTAAESD